jgi:hypothetical protein
VELCLALKTRAKKAALKRDRHAALLASDAAVAVERMRGHNKKRREREKPARDARRLDFALVRSARAPFLAARKKAHLPRQVAACRSKLLASKRRKADALPRR